MRCISKVSFDIGAPLCCFCLHRFAWLFNAGFVLLLLLLSFEFDCSYYYFLTRVESAASNQWLFVLALAFGFGFGLCGLGEIGKSNQSGKQTNCLNEAYLLTCLSILA